MKYPNLESLSHILSEIVLQESNLNITDLSSTSLMKGKGKPLKSNTYFVIHHTAGEGTAKGVMSVLNNRKGGALGVQFIIDKEGNLFRGLPAGSVGAHVASSDRRGGIPKDLSNSTAQGVEIIGSNDTKINLKQCKTALLLIRSLGYSKSNIYGHGEIQTNKQPNEGATCKRYAFKYWDTPEEDLPIVDEEISKLQKQNTKPEKSPSSEMSVDELRKKGLSQNFYKGTAASNINLLLDKLKAKGITDPVAQIGFLATVGKESQFVPQNENSYKGTPNERIRKKFSSTSKLSDSDLNKLKSNDEDFFNYVYGPKGVGRGLGNTQPGDGYKYRGRGFNQITGRGNYTAYGYSSNPDELNSTEGAADAAINFLTKEGSALNDKFSSVNDAISFFVTRNAGGKKTQEGESKAKEVARRFNIGGLSGDQFSSVDGGETQTQGSEDGGEKKKIRPINLKFLDPLISLARGEEPETIDLFGGLKNESINEEVYRIKDIIKKIL